MATKLTKKDYFKMIKEIVGEERKDLQEFCDKEIALLEKKNTNKGATKTQKENEEIKVKVLQALRVIGEKTTITNLQANDEEMAQYSNQKLSALLKQLVESNKVIRTQEKKVTYFEINDEQV